ncbi:hypothetical protein RJ639_010640 [Escallonia herrerae]|uniref:Uncharacterized protein n=1 Tax=Escallonia herrerae TaxID=1293975 RepID=A0AA88VJX8_9ASTE|nr:hypothetical protein RJ639_010640 [Escallonia herrerae]
MEDPQLAQTLTQNVPPQSAPSAGKKRPLDSNVVDIQESKYFKMRAVLIDLRPHFIEVLRTPDFQNCKAACEIRENMKLMMDLYKEMTAETITRQNEPQGQALPGDVQDGQKSHEQHQDLEPAEQPPPDRMSGHMPEKQGSEDDPSKGTYIVGGSAFGWNFITFPGDKAVYYGRTRETFRSANVISNA